MEGEIIILILIIAFSVVMASLIVIFNETDRSSQEKPTIVKKKYTKQFEKSVQSLDLDLED